VTAVDVVALDEAQDIDRLVAPEGVVVVGASRDPDKLGGAMASRLADFPGPVALVNARGADGMHRTVGDAVTAIRVAGGRADLAVLCVPAGACPDVVRECGRHGIAAALICAGGFAEVGIEGAALQELLLRVAHQAQVRVLGPNTSGFFAPGRGLFASFVPGVTQIEAGSVGLVAASGGLNHSLAFAFQRESVGLSLGVGIGAGIDVTAVDVLRHLAEDPGTTAIALHLETVTDGRALLEAVRVAAARKPVVAMVVGRHDVTEFARSHTGALATSWRTTRDLLREAGAVLVERADDLVTATSVLSRLRLPPGATRVGLVTAQAGPGLVVADALQEAGVELPALDHSTRERLAAVLPPMTYQANPVDTGRPGPEHAEVIRTVAQDAHVDVVAVYGLLEPVVDLPGAVAASMRAGYPVLLGVDGAQVAVHEAHRELAGTGVPVVTGPQALACAVTALVHDARRRAHSATPPPRPVPDPGPGPWDEARAKALLDDLGIATPARRVCRDRAAAHEALDALGAPVVVKVCDSAILHKSDVGGVVVGVTTHEEVDEALDRLATIGSPAVLVESMAPDGIDLIVGARRDAVFGPVLLVGLGGTAAEADADVAVAASPAAREILRDLPDRLRGRARLDGFRGQPAVDRDRLADVLDALGALLDAHEHLTDIEINPLRSTRDGLVALDAVVVARETEGT
jgi:acetyltransferase